MALKPPNVSFEAAATVAISGISALQGLRDLGHVQSGQTVLVNGASGGVGTFSVQIAKSFGAEVNGVCSTPNLDFVRAIGAAHVVDYTKEDFARTGQRYDLILDAVGNHSVSDFKRALKTQGTCVVVGFTTMSRLLGIVIMGKLATRAGAKTFRLKTGAISKEGLVAMGDLMAAGKVKPAIEHRYPLANFSEALCYLETGHARGKLVIEVS